MIGSLKRTSKIWSAHYQNNPAAIAAYSNTQRTSANGELLDEFFSREFDVRVSKARQLHANSLGAI